MTKSATGFFPPESGPLARLTKPIAVLRLNPGDLYRRIGIQFHTAHDDLDALDWARVTGLSGRPYALVHHRHAPEPGTQIVVPHDSKDSAADLMDVLRALALSEQDLSWASEEARAGIPEIEQSRGAQTGRRVVARKAGAKLAVKVSPRVAVRLRNIHGRGAFQSLLRQFEKRVKGSELVVTPADVEKLISYSAELGTSSRTLASGGKSTKRASRKK